MSRIGKKSIPIPAGVSVSYKDGTIVVKGKRGELTQTIRSEIQIEIEADQLWVRRVSDHRTVRGFHGLYRSLIANMVQGVTVGFTKILEIHGVGYRASLDKVEGRDCVVFKKGEIGLSHPIYFELPKGIEAEVPERTKIILRGNDKSTLGLVAAKIRALRPPDAYKGKGIRYATEHVRTKVGKTGV